MTRPCQGALRPCALALLLLSAPGAALAQEVSTIQGASPAEALPAHSLTLYFPFGATAWLSGARTIGGIGGGLGVRDTLEERFILQADVQYLLGIRNAGMLRLGAGLQRRGLYTPAVVLTLSGLFGEGFNFLTPLHPTPIRAPAMALGLNLAPVRFTSNRTQLSLLEVGLGIGTDFPGLGLQYHVQLVEVGTSF